MYKVHRKRIKIRKIISCSPFYLINAGGGVVEDVEAITLMSSEFGFSEFADEVNVDDWANWAEVDKRLG